MLKPRRVTLWAEERDPTEVVRHFKGFEPFKDFLAVVEAWCKAMDMNVGDEYQGCPFACHLFNVAVDCKGL